MLANILEGKACEEIPPAVFEVIFAAVNGWTLEYIRSLSLTDFRLHAPLVLAVFRRITQERVM